MWQEPVARRGDHMKVADFGLSKLVKVTHLHEMYRDDGGDREL